MTGHHAAAYMQPLGIVRRGRDHIAAAITSLYRMAGSLPATIDESVSAEEAAKNVHARVTRSDAYDGLGALERESVDLICTSPPYWGHRTYDQDHSGLVLDAWRRDADDPRACPPYAWYRDHGGVLGLEPYPEWYIAHLVEIVGVARAGLKRDANVWINLGNTYFGRWSSIRPRGRHGLAGEARSRRRTPSGGWLHDKQLLMIPARFAIAMQDAGWILRNDLIWANSAPLAR
jgi:site-specific DNA-methyltransferase (cytosine-N4-specific)